LTLFLYLHDKRPFLAGFAFPLLFAKPHLLLAFGLVLVAWFWRERPLRTIAGALLSLACVMTVPLWSDPQICSHYLPVLRDADVQVGWIPTMSSVTRQLLFHGQGWGQYVPALMACVWAGWYYRRHALEWNWLRHGSLVILVSLWSAPYSWFTDEALAVVPLLGAVYASKYRRSLLAGLAILNAFCIVVRFFLDIPLSSGIFIWSTTAWLIAYQCASRTSELDVGNAKSASLSAPG
jgi:hypothetical protein